MIGSLAATSDRAPGRPVIKVAFRDTLRVLFCFLSAFEPNTGTAAPNGIVYHSFTAPTNGTNQDGVNPASGLVLSGGLLCGTTVNGGLRGAGSAYYLAPDASAFNAFHSFTNSPDAANPQGNFVNSGSNFFGTTVAGGSSGVGTVFLGKTNGTSSIIRSFPAVSANNATNVGGASPSGALVLSGATLYGTTTAGGAAASGTVFSLSTNGSTFSVLHDFTALDSNTGTNADGELPLGGLVLTGNTLYGTASGGGPGGAGVVFAINTSGGSFTVLHGFTALDPLTATNTDGAFPFNGLATSNGMLFGTTLAGGHHGKGVVFSIGTNGTGFAVLHHFSATDPLTGTNQEGASPCAPLALSGGYLYGTASAGGLASGTIFSVSTNGAQFQLLHTFATLDASSGTNTDGALPVAGLLPLGNSLFGVAYSGGPGGAGTVFGVPIPFPPAIITNIVYNSNGTVTLYFSGGPNSTNIIQAAGGLTPSPAWVSVSTNVADASGAWRLTETNTANSMRFYRSYAP